jgi:hypothetical protein
MMAHPSHELSAFLDGDLDAAAHAAVEQHLAGCAECRAVLADLTALGHAAVAWGAGAAAPSSDLWPSIAARLNGPRDAALPAASGAPFPIAAPRTAWYRRRWTLGLPELALAASLAVAVGGALAWQRTPPAAPAAAEPIPIVAQLESLEPDDAAVTPVNFADPQYDAAVVDLERVLREQRERLDPRTVVVLERNLRVIDDAIAEARQALATDPANALLNAHLAGARQRKLDLLRRAALITGGD